MDKLDQDYINFALTNFVTNLFNTAINTAIMGKEKRDQSILTQLSGLINVPYNIARIKLNIDIRKRILYIKEQVMIEMKEDTASNKEDKLTIAKSLIAYKTKKYIDEYEFTYQYPLSEKNRRLL